MLAYIANFALSLPNQHLATTSAVALAKVEPFICIHLQTMPSVNPYPAHTYQNTWVYPLPYKIQNSVTCFFTNHYEDTESMYVLVGNQPTFLRVIHPVGHHAASRDAAHRNQEPPNCIFHSDLTRTSWRDWTKMRGTGGD